MIITWAALAAVCLIAELLTGTFYLLVLTVAFAGACGLAALDTGIPAQISLAAIIGVIGLLAVQRWRTRRRDASPAATLENAVATVVGANGALYRVRWRGSEWNARGPEGLSENATVRITGQSGNTLHIEP
jgi:membrane protein implicated in regulation of membrane protease activity